MPTYRYTGKVLDGSIVAGTTAAESHADLGSRLVKRGVFLESARLTQSNAQRLFLRWFKQAEITKALRQLQILLDSAVPVMECLELVGEQIKDRGLRAILSDIQDQVESGISLAAAFASHKAIFDESVTAILEAGESSGGLAFALDRIATYRERKEEALKKLRSALSYPALVVLVAILVVTALVLYVVPVFASMYANFGLELPAMTRTIVAVSDYLRSTFWYLALGVLLVLVTVLSVLRTDRVQLLLHLALLRIPGLSSFMRKLLAARFSRTLGALLETGVDIVYAVDVATRSVGNPVLANRMQTSRDMLVEGKSLTDTLTSVDLFPRAVLRLSASGEKSGQLGRMLLRSSDFYDNEINTDLSTFTTLIEPLTILLLGGFVALMLVAMYLPLFDLVGGL